ncbi:MAG: hypothetical protein R2764_23985 [Bacteroidales bacterium]
MLINWVMFVRHAVCPEKYLNLTEKESRKRDYGCFNFDFHPIAIHFSQAFVGAIPLLFLFTALFPNFYAEELTIVNKVMIITLPLTMFVAFITGMMDGYTRFKTFNTPMLVRKIVLSGIITLLSGIASFLLITGGLTSSNKLIIIFLILGCLVCAVVLGLMEKATQHYFAG